jgi:hypothetical protein
LVGWLVGWLVGSLVLVTVKFTLEQDMKWSDGISQLLLLPQR